MKKWNDLSQVTSRLPRMQLIMPRYDIALRTVLALLTRCCFGCSESFIVVVIMWRENLWLCHMLLFIWDLCKHYLTSGNWYIVGIIKWLLGDRSDSWVSFLTRQTLEDATSYEHAKLLLTNTTVLAPVYFILGGTKSHEVNCFCVHDGTEKPVCWLLWVKAVSHISQGSVATRLRCIGIFNDDFVGNLLLRIMVKNFWKLDSIWKSFGEEYNAARNKILTHSASGLVFVPRCTSWPHW